jgi:AraC-like DNA-binding protein
MHIVAAVRSPALTPFVSSLSYHRGALPPGRERILPDGTMTLMVNLDEDEFRTYSGPGNSTVRRVRGAVLGGASACPTVIDTQEQRCGLAVSFRIGGAAPFFPGSLADTSSQLVELDALWGRDGAVLRDRLLAAATPAAQFRVLESMLLSQVTLPLAADQAIACAAAALDRGVPVGQVSDHLGLLPKRFVRRFRDQVGLTPKLFSRVRRLQRVLGSLDPGQPTDWATVAAEHGYCDQPHLIDDFRDLTGITPGAYRPRSAGEHNHVTLP